MLQFAQVFVFIVTLNWFAMSSAADVLQIKDVEDMFKNIGSCQKITKKIGDSYKCNQAKDSVIVFSPDGSIMRKLDILFAHNPAQIKKIKTVDKPEATISAINEEQAQAVFDRFRNMQGLKSMDSLENCAGRAKIIADKLKKEVQVQVGFARVSKGLLGSFDVQFPEKSSRSPVPFEYHVAPVVLVKLPDGKEELRVIDPLLDRNKPLPLGEWQSRLSKNPNRNNFELRSTPL